MTVFSRPTQFNYSTGTFVTNEVALVDFASLRQHALKQATLEPGRFFDKREREALEKLYIDFVLKQMDETRASNLENPGRPEIFRNWSDSKGFAILKRDLNDYGTLKLSYWGMLASWLTPESIAGSEPQTAAAIAKLMFDGQLGKYRAGHPQNPYHGGLLD